MKKDDFITEVMFRKEKDGQILAVFPYDISTIEGKSSCYAHVGQHSSCDHLYVLMDTKPAKPEEYADLKSELESIGYNLKVIKRRNFKRYISFCDECRNEE